MFFAISSLVHRPGLVLVTLLTLVSSSGCITDIPASEIERTPYEKAESKRNLGIDHVVSGRVAYGLRELQHALLLNPDDSLTHLWLGQAYRLKGREVESLTHATRAVELDPTNHEARLNLSSIYIDHQQYDAAVAHAQMLIDDPTFPSPWRPLTNRGWAQLKQGYLSEARASFEEALEFHGRYWPASLDLGILAQVERDYRESIRYYSEVIRLEPGAGPEAEANYRMAEAYVALGHRDRAIRHLTEAIEQTPHGPWGRQSREYLMRLQ